MANANDVGEKGAQVESITWRALRGEHYVEKHYVEKHYVEKHYVEKHYVEKRVPSVPVDRGQRAWSPQIAFELAKLALVVPLNSRRSVIA